MSIINSLSNNMLQSKITPFLFSVLIVGLLCKQLQFGAFGFVEVATAAMCLILCAAKIASDENIPGSTLILPFGLFAVIVITTTFAYVTDPERVGIRDAIAYSFTSVIVCSFILASHGRELIYVKALCLVSASSLLVFLLLAIVPSPIQGFMYYQNSWKLQGLSTNPNQIGFLAVTTLTLLLVLDFSGTISKKTVIVASIACGLAGSMSGSSAYTLAVLTTMLLIILFRIGRWSKGLPFRFPFAIGFPALFAVLSFFPLAELSFFEGLPSQHIGVARGGSGNLFDLEADSGQGSARLALWQNAFSILAASPVIGLGPGAHVPLADENTGTVSLNEAHNTAIDILVVTGLFGFSLFLILLFRIFFAAYKSSQLFLLLVCLAPIGVYSLLHFLGRQPMFWIVLCLANLTFILLLRHERALPRNS